MNLPIFRTSLAAAAFALAVAPSAPVSAATIAEYALTSNVAATSADPNTTVSNANFTGSGASGSVLNGLGLGMNVASGANSSATAITTNSYFQFSVTPNSGYALNLSSLSFQSAGAHGVTGNSVDYFMVRSSVDGFASDLLTGHLNLYPAMTAYNVGLGNSFFQNLTTSTVFRLYGYATGGVGGPNLVFKDLTLSGTVSGGASVPEPATLALLAVGAVGLVRRRQAAPAAA